MVDGDGNEHLVTLRAFQQGLSEGSRHYVAVCGQSITVGGMTTSSTSVCSRCGARGSQS